ncbi:prolipoprotein diacylglyceryl transferase [Nannocystis bainbridge]|uniref:Prolipoprotein diacylglyceryl transferase n=1 Tax=Nannocystis bainbridge TaxID=2995303 RepID=A0ABT5E128_9BACT|nr:prolipoprotein diacylglyceryl transferase family protein [Nannocystis bainbridge]MDC0719590.1 prolipoprotein diacylglyceryl transferase [Nannocystis bainbridge]
MAPELFTLPGLGWAITSYGLAVAVALVTAWLVSLLLARRDKLPPEVLGTVFVLSAIAGLLAARAGHLLQQGQGLELSHLRSLPAGGLAVFGGLFAALAVATIGCRRFQVPTLAWLDCWAPAVALGGVIERVGAFFAGADFGMYVGPGDLGHGLGVTYPAGSPAFLLHTAAFPGLPGLTETTSAPVHPVQLYLAATCVVAAGAGFLLRRFRRFSGQPLLAVAAVFLLGRAVVFEPLRFDASPLTLGPLRLQQVSGLGLLLAVAVAWWMLSARAAAQPKLARQWEGGPWTPRA